MLPAYGTDCHSFLFLIEVSIIIGIVLRLFDLRDLPLNFSFKFRQKIRIAVDYTILPSD